MEKMFKRSICFTVSQNAELEAKAGSLGISVSELLRRILENRSPPQSGIALLKSMRVPGGNRE